MLSALLEGVRRGVELFSNSSLLECATFFAISWSQQKRALPDYVLEADVLNSGLFFQAT